MFFPEHHALLSCLNTINFNSVKATNPLLTASLPLKQRLVTAKSTYSNLFNSTETKISIQGKDSFVSVSIIAKLAYDINCRGENTTQNLGSCQKVIPRRDIIIETANKIINKQGNSVILDFFTNCSNLYQ